MEQFSFWSPWLWQPLHLTPKFEFAVVAAVVEVAAVEHERWHYLVTGIHSKKHEGEEVKHLVWKLKHLFEFVLVADNGVQARMTAMGAGPDGIAGRSSHWHGQLGAGSVGDVPDGDDGSLAELVWSCCSSLVGWEEETSC